MKRQATLIFDIGKTNKKCLLFDANFRVITSRQTRIVETVDEDGFPCDDLPAITDWVWNMWKTMLQESELDITHINFSTYGASLVHLNANGKPITPLYNYLKPLPPETETSFIERYGSISLETASPFLGMLNSGLQLYWLKHQKPEVFAQIKYSLHLPQYLSFLFTGKAVSDFTSIGCHTMLWDFTQGRYHAWVQAEGLESLLAPIVPANQSFVIPLDGLDRHIGTGIHDSSAALIPYMAASQGSFLLISTGTWSITMNPGNNEKLTEEDLQMDCLQYLRYDGNPVKAARLFLGAEFEYQLEKLETYYHIPIDKLAAIPFRQPLYEQLKSLHRRIYHFEKIQLCRMQPQKTVLLGFKDAEEAVHQLMIELIEMQWLSCKRVMGETSCPVLFVDGGFSDNELYNAMLKNIFPKQKIRSGGFSNGTALGAALVVQDEKSWEQYIPQRSTLS